MFLIVGGNSEVGSATANYIRAQGGDVMTTTRRASGDGNQTRFDLASSIESFHVPEGIDSACICAAIARLAACAADPEGSARINVGQTIALVDRLVQRGIFTLFLSSNQVFGGDEPHVPANAPLSPVSEYGRQKAEVERMLQVRMSAGAPIGVLRLSKVVSPTMPLIAHWVTELKAGRPIRAFTDMTLAPVPVGLAAQSIARIMEAKFPVIAQLSGPRDAAYFDVARFLATKIGVDPKLVRAASALSEGMPAGSTPRHTTLDSRFIADKYGLSVPDIYQVVQGSQHV